MVEAKATIPFHNVYNSPAYGLNEVAQYQNKDTYSDNTIIPQNSSSYGNIDDLFQNLSIEDVLEHTNGPIRIETGPYKKCRFCGNEEESVEHITSKCLILAPMLYRERHDKVARAIHWCLCNIHGIATSKEWRDHQVSDLTETADVKIYWNYSMLTYKRVAHNRPDIVVVDKKKEKVFIVEVAVSRDGRVHHKERFKHIKYEELAREMAATWHSEVHILPIIVGAYGSMRHYTRSCLAALDIVADPLFLQKIAFKETIIILRKILEDL